MHARLAATANFVVQKIAGSRLTRPLFGPSVSEGYAGRHSLALTFDDGPSPGTLRLLDCLAKYHVRATFFQCGVNVRRYSQISQRVSFAGHELGNHTDSHPCLCPTFGPKTLNLSSAEVFDNIARAQMTFETELGVTPALLRVPYGLSWSGVRQAQAHLALLDVMWTVIGHDWEWPASKVVEFVTSHVRPGGIICLHDGLNTEAFPDVSSMLGAIGEIISRLLDRGFSFETVSQIIVPGPRECRAQGGH